MSLFNMQPRLIGWTLSGGLLGFILWELYSGPVNQAIWGFTFGPLPLIKGLLGIDSNMVAWVLHILTGVVAYSLAYSWVLRPLIKTHWIAPALILGLATWFFALGIMAPLAGNPFMLNWGNITWASLIGHVLLGLGIGLLAERGFSDNEGTAAVQS